MNAKPKETRLRMNAAFAIIVILLLSCDRGHSVFVTTPGVIIPKKTDNVELRCDPQLQDAIAILALHIRKKSGNDVVKVDQSHGQSKEDVTTLPDIQASVQVTEAQDNKIMLPQLTNFDETTLQKRKKRSTETDFVRATITAGNNMDIVPQNQRFKAEGDVEKPGYLSVTITSPDVNDLGVYECQATYLDSKGNVQTSSELVQVKETENLTLEDLEERVKKLEDMAPIYIAVIHEVETIARETKSLNGMLETDMVSLRKENEELKGTMQEMTREMQTMSTRLTTISEQYGLDGSSANSQGDSEQPRGQGELRSDEMYKVNARFDQVINTHIQTLSTHLFELKGYVRDVQDRVVVLELTVNAKLDQRVGALEAFNWKGIAESLQQIEMKTIPLVQKDIADCQRNITALQSGAIQPHNNEESQGTNEIQNEIITPTTETPETTTKTYTGPACYVCGNNETEQHCPLSMIKNTNECSRQAPYCLTDVYQNGSTRHVYKRCASVKECRSLTPMSSPECATDTFVQATPMKCHFCCTTILCNEGIRPPRDLV